MDKIYLASYKAKGNWVDKVIRFFTKGKYSHSEIAVEKTQGSQKRFEIYSSSPRDGGVRMKKMTELEPDKWDLIELPDITEQDVKAYYEKTKGMRYDFFGAIGTKLLIRQSRSKMFCSEWVFNLLQKSTEGWRFDPNQLHAVFKNKAGN